MRNVFLLSIAGAFYFFIVLSIGILLWSIVIPTFLFGFPTESATNV